VRNCRYGLGYIVGKSNKIKFLSGLSDKLVERVVVTVNMSLFLFLRSASNWKWLLLALPVLAVVVPAVAAVTTEIDLRLGPGYYRVELATTPDQRRRGLMYRDQLDPERGLLLVYPQSGDHRIWMKNMRMALRVFWIDDKYRVISVQRLEPCRKSPCPVFSAPRPSRYILELGDLDHPLAVGDKIEGLNKL
jgi:uncharacterized membrane protein (UPF0127 family)